MALAGKAGAAVFTAIYGIIFFYVTFQAFWLIRQRHRKTSFKMAFNVLTMLWSVPSGKPSSANCALEINRLQELAADSRLGQLI